MSEDIKKKLRGPTLGFWVASVLLVSLAYTLFKSLWPIIETTGEPEAGLGAILGFYALMAILLPIGWLYLLIGLYKRSRIAAAISILAQPIAWIIIGSWLPVVITGDNDIWDKFGIAGSVLAWGIDLGLLTLFIFELRQNIRLRKQAG